MNADAWGQLFSLLSALAFASALIFYRKSGETVAPLPLNLFKNVVALLLLGATLLIWPHGTAALAEYNRGDWALLLLSGVIGIAIADTLFLFAINRLGVGLMVVVDCLYSPATILFAWVLLSETLAGVHFLGGPLVIAGVIISSFHAPPPGRTRLEVVIGVLAGAAGAALMALGITLAKPLLDTGPLLWLTFIRLTAGTLPLALLMALLPARRRLFGVFRPAGHWRHSLPAAFLASYLCLWLWHAGFKFTDASVAAILNQTSTIFALILATLILRERFSRRKLVSVTLALAGVVLVVFGEQFVAQFARA